MYFRERTKVHSSGPNQYLFEGSNYYMDFLRPFKISSLPKPKNPEEKIKIKLEWNFANQNTEKATDTFSQNDVRKEIFDNDFITLISAFFNFFHRFLDIYGRLMHVEGSTFEATLLCGRNWIVIKVSQNLSLSSIIDGFVIFQADLVNFMDVMNISKEELYDQQGQLLKNESYVIIKGVRLIQLEEEVAKFWCFKDSVLIVSEFNFFCYWSYILFLFFSFLQIFCVG